MINLMVTEEELKIIRAALCRQSMKMLCTVHRVQREAEEAGLKDTTSWIWKQEHDAVNVIIDRIDAEQQ